jgi:hypothetical protein
MTPCCLEGAEDGNNMFHRHDGEYWTVDVALCLRRLEFSTEIMFVVS